MMPPDLNQDDGVALVAAAHPIAPWPKRVWLSLRNTFRPAISEDALETVEIEIKDGQETQDDSRRAERCGSFGKDRQETRQDHQG